MQSKKYELMDTERAISPVEAAKFTGLSVKTLANLRWRKTGPKWISLSRRAVRYRVRDLLAWLAENEKQTERSESWVK